MTREELLADIDNATQEFAEQIAATAVERSGVPRSPSITVTETQIETQPFNLDLDRNQPAAEAFPGGGGGGGGTPTLWACCHDDDTCTDTTFAACVGEYHVGHHCAEEGFSCVPTCDTGYFVIDSTDGPGFFTTASVTIYRRSESASDPTGDYIELNATFHATIVEECCTHGIPDSFPGIYGCSSCVTNEIVSGTFINHFHTDPDLTCTLIAGTGGAVACMKWGNPVPPGVNCCCGFGSVDNSPWYADIYGACTGGTATVTETRLHNNYSLVCEELGVSGLNNYFSYVAILS